MPKPLSPEREHEIRALDWLTLIRENSDLAAANTIVNTVIDLLNEIDRLRRPATLVPPASFITKAMANVSVPDALPPNFS